MFYESTRTFEGMNIFTPEVRKCFRTRTVHNYTYTYSTHLSESMIHPTCTVRRYFRTTLYNNVPNVAFVILPEVSISGNRIRVHVYVVLPEVQLLSKVLSYFRTSESTTVLYVLP